MISHTRRFRMVLASLAQPQLVDRSGGGLEFWGDLTSHIPFASVIYILCLSRVSVDNLNVLKTIP